MDEARAAIALMYAVALRGRHSSTPLAGFSSQYPSSTSPSPLYGSSSSLPSSQAKERVRVDEGDGLVTRIAYTPCASA